MAVSDAERQEMVRRGEERSRRARENPIPLERCEDRHVYRLYSRNLTSGVFQRATSGFIGIREKFGSRYLFEEYHHDTGPPYGTATPYEDLGELPAEIEAREVEPDVCSATNLPCEWRADDGIRPPGKWYYVGTADVIQGTPLARTYQPLFEYLDRLPDD